MKPVLVTLRPIWWTLILVAISACAVWMVVYPRWTFEESPIASRIMLGYFLLLGTYWPSNQIFSTWNFQYEINPDLANTSSTFYQAQCGNYNATTNPSGFISGANLLAQTNRHEWNSSTESHYAFYTNRLSSNNPGDFLEQQTAPPGANLTTFAQNSTSGINSRLATVATDSDMQPYPVNYSETGLMLGNINYAPYSACN